MDHLRPSKVDHVSSIAKGIAGGIPVVGGLVAELVGSIIPNQRLERITKFLEILDRRLAELGEEVARMSISQPKVTSLVEEGIISAYRAHSEVRQHLIACVIKNGAKNLRTLEAKRVLSILDQLNDAEVELLQGYALMRLPYEGNIPSLADSKERRHAYAIRESYHSHLEQLGLVGSPLAVEEDPWGKTQIEKGRPQITALGRAVIAFIDGSIIE